MRVLHITSGDCAGDLLAKTGIPGEISVWRDVLYDGPRNPGWPDDATLQARAEFFETLSGGDLARDVILAGLMHQYGTLAHAKDYARIVLWFDACLFDQAILVHILTCLRILDVNDVDLLCIDAFPGVKPYDGLGQLYPEQLASVYDRRRPVSEAQFRFAEVVDRAFALRDVAVLREMSVRKDAPLPWVPAAVARWLQELPDPVTGLGRLEQLSLDAIRNGSETPGEIYRSVAAHDSRPQFWGDTTLWARINSLADRDPPLVEITGPGSRLPQWNGGEIIGQFRIKASGSAVIGR